MRYVDVFNERHDLMNRRRRSVHWLAAFGVTLLLTIVNYASAQSLDGPALLAAAPDVEGIYSRAVVLALPAGRTQYVGFIINRVSKHTLASVFPKYGPSKKVVDPIYIGGPDSLGTIFAFVRATSDPPVDAIWLFEDLFVTAAPKAVQRIIERTPNKARYVTGYISWMEGELEAEIESGFWNICEPHAELLFRKDVDTLWTEVISKMPRKELLGSVPNQRRRSVQITEGGSK
jgi:putative transcriptional regulator